MVKFRLYYDKDKEEVFLNSMANQGWCMERFILGFYRFRPCEKGEYTYRIDLTNDKSAAALRDLFELIQDSGGEVVQTWGVWTIFRKRGSFELYTDPQSKISHYTRIRNLFFILALAETAITVSNLMSAGRTQFPLIPGLLLGLISIVFWVQTVLSQHKINQIKSAL